MLEFATITVFMLFAAAAPGADFALVVRNSLLYSRRAAIYTAIGIGAGLAVHTAYSLLGLAVIIANSLTLFTIVKYIGAAYLIYLGIRSIMDSGGAGPASVQRAERDLGRLEAFRQGFLCNVLNPKAPLVFIAFYSVVLPADATLTVKALYGLEFMVVVGGWFCLLACLITHHTVKAILGRAQRVFSRALGGMMIYFGVKLALSEQ